jgi:hypothetical protein
VKATEGQLGELHSLLASHLSLRLQGDSVSDGTLAVITKFLKDNSITATADQSSSLGELEEALRARAKRRKLTPDDLSQELGAIGRSLVS